MYIAMSPATEGFSIDEIIDKAQTLCNELPPTADHQQYRSRIRDLRERLAQGKLRLAVLGQFNRGKSTFINALLRLHVLPTSVLPITSAPTVIAYGHALRCSIAFADHDPIESNENDPAAVYDLLLQYVAEENNPRNHRGVSEVIVECQSPVLHHGTVLIDTPGFGSTHIHNTRTTLDLLSSCDAALFLLSADLPITQVEVDFLKEVKQAVPRLFFIYNKTDLLNQRELEQTQRYIRGVLVRDCNIASDVRLFPVCAKVAEPSPSDAPDRAAWDQSGMESVKTEIIDFMLREKYFALSEAITGKLTESIDGINQGLSVERAEIDASIQTSETAVTTASRYLDEIRKEIKKELQLLSIENESMQTHARKHARTAFATIRDQAHARLSHLIDSSSISGSQLTLLGASLAELVQEMLRSAWLDAVSAANRPLRKAVRVHQRQLTSLAERLGEDLGVDTRGLVSAREQPGEDSELEIDAAWVAPDINEDDFAVRLSFAEKFGGADKKRRYYSEKASPVLEERLDTSMRELAGGMERCIDSAVAGLRTRLEEAYGKLERLCEQRRSAAARELERKRSELQPRIQEIDSLRERFEEVRNMLA